MVLDRLEVVMELPEMVLDNMHTCQSATHDRRPLFVSKDLRSQMLETHANGQPPTVPNRQQAYVLMYKLQV